MHLVKLESHRKSNTHVQNPEKSIQALEQSIRPLFLPACDYLRIHSNQSAGQVGVTGSMSV